MLGVKHATCQGLRARAAEQFRDEIAHCAIGMCLRCLILVSLAQVIHCGVRSVRILEELGTGGLGRTVRAEWTAGPDQAPFALKILTHASASRRAILRREFFALRGMGHPNLVRAFDYGRFAIEHGESVTGIALELVRGVALSDFGCSWADVTSGLADALEALEAMHRQGFVHGDVKPDNVLVRADGTGVLLDLSAVSPLGAAPTGERTGTPGFMAPELGAVVVTTALDVFALGRTLSVLTHRLGAAPAAMGTWMQAALNPDPTLRPRALDALLDALRGPARRTAPESFVTRLIGRREVLADLERAVLEPAGPRMVWLRGEPGSGRSRLLGELRWALSECAEVRSLDAERGLSEVVALPSALPTVLLCVEPPPALRRSLEAASMTDPDTTVVIASAAPPRVRHCELVVTPLTLADARELFPASFPAPSVQRAHRLSAGSARTLVTIARAAVSMQPTAAAVDRLLEAAPMPLACEARPDALEHARTLRYAGQAERAIRVIAAALRRCRVPADAIELRIEAAACQLACGHPRNARRTLARVGTHASTRALDVQAELALKSGDYAEAATLAQSQASEPDVAWSLAITHASARVLLDSPDAASALERARTRAPTPAPPRLAYRLLSTEALHSHRQGQLREAERTYRAAAALVERESLDDLRAGASYNVATTAEQSGQIGAALETYERTLRLARLTGSTSIEARARFALANLLFELGQSERAQVHASGARDCADRAGLAVLGALSRALEAEALQTPSAFAAARRALPSSAREGAESLEIATAEARCETPTIPRLGELLHWAERLDATDLRARILVLWPLAEASAPALEALLASVLACGSRFRALDLHERLHAIYTHQDLTLHAAEHATRGLYLAEALLADIPAGLRAPLALRASGLRAQAPLTAASNAAWPEEVARLFDVQRQLSSAASVDELLGAALDCAIVLAGAERGFVVLATGSGFDVRAARNLDATKLSGRELSFSRSIVRDVLASQTPRFAVRSDGEKFLATQRSVHAQKLRAVVALPFATERGVQGAVYLDNRFVAVAPSARAKEVLLFLRDQIAAALDRALLVAELAARNRELERQRSELETLLRDERAELARRAAAARHQVALRSDKFPAILGNSEPLRRALALLERVAHADVTVLIEGESGTGKELFARALHDESARNAGPFVAINCGAMPEALLEAELFGATRGAFTGAVKDTRGLLVAAAGGTLFLDEIGEMPLSMQVKLLRVLQQREVRALGSDRVTPVDLRVVGATHRDLEEEIRHGRFREDLFFRLAVVRLVVPPLRERGADIVVIANALLDRTSAALGLRRRELAPSALRALMQHRFPGNVRELENALTKALVLTGSGDAGELLEAEHLGLPHATSPRTRGLAPAQERKRLVDALEATHGNVVAAAKHLGMPRATFYRKIARHGIPRK